MVERKLACGGVARRRAHFACSAKDVTRTTAQARQGIVHGVMIVAGVVVVVVSRETVEIAEMATPIELRNSANGTERRGLVGEFDVKVVTERNNVWIGGGGERGIGVCIRDRGQYFSVVVVVVVVVEMVVMVEVQMKVKMEVEVEVQMKVKVEVEVEVEELGLLVKNPWAISSPFPLPRRQPLGSIKRGIGCFSLPESVFLGLSNK
ncbi:hypothetical protein E2C01_044586 [Portunus trituberculatus]|uniref:Uncharacterized protein n=1 Tax=Portunus trituberculatus TaxID=210409 RepID=A0A5B7FYS5_PORTR|nr:hypothetical protein [Portunus trituberculatus]